MIPFALEQARSRAASAWPGSRLVCASGHGLGPDGCVHGDGAMWFYVFADQGKPRALVNNARGWSVLQDPPHVGMDLVPLSEGSAVPMRTVVQHFCGQAGFDALRGQLEDSAWFGMRDGELVVAIQGSGGAGAVLSATEPSRFLAMDFEPVSHGGPVV